MKKDSLMLKMKKDMPHSNLSRSLARQANPFVLNIEEREKEFVRGVLFLFRANALTSIQVSGYIITINTIKGCARKQQDSHWTLGGMSAGGAPSKGHRATSGDWERHWGLVYIY